MRGPADADVVEGAIQDQIDAALADVMRQAGASVGLLYLLPADEQVLRLTVVTGIAHRIATPWTRVTLHSLLPVADAVRERRLVCVGSREDMARRYPMPALVLPYDFTLAAAPILAGGRAWGGLVVLWPGSHPPQPSRAERRAITSACRRMGLLLQRAHDQGRPILPGPAPRTLALPRARTPGPAEALAAADFAERLPEGCCGLDLDGRITFITTTAAALLGSEVPDLLGALPWEVLPWLQGPMVEDRYRAALVARGPTSCTVLRPPKQWLTFWFHPDASGVSVRIAPAASPQDPRAERLETPADTTAPSQASALYHLMHLAGTLAEAVGVGDVVERTMDQLIPAVDAQAMAVMTAQEGRLRIIGYRGYSAELMARFDAQPLVSRAPASHVLTTGVPLFFATFADLKDFYPPAVHQDDMGSWAFLPLIASGRVVGSLVLAFDRPRPFPPAERAVLTSVAGLIAQALDRARLYDAKHHLAHTLQTGLLPRTLPRIPGLEVAARYLPAGHGMDIGGDFYDLIRCGPAAAAAAIGDVQGHNLTAAALMGQVRTAVHAHATAGASPGEVLDRTNRLLTDLDPGLFTSCLYASLDLARHRAHLATAGHPPPLLRHPGGHAEPLHLPPGLLLGIDPAADYTTTEIPFPPGSMLVLYTDGLVEAPGADIEQAAAELADRLTRTPDRPLDACADTLLAEGMAPRNDDIALLVIRAAAP
ncbi:GAF domain-containing protein [Thermocatellispora tengchongensis]|uniref:protein-serine/threonine phosphatase n=1 Tax=Thermocatellispora tengchongensis TaxID=1073253 RepID=A0A840P8J3_9ACTN|nr:SpoIIE family protein phosphatase [Thermocatellispora tengchongensis]MBB5133760.1 GAF domain-containing protein [Thermocatellispora tengchongensis]